MCVRRARRIATLEDSGLSILASISILLFAFEKGPSSQFLFAGFGLLRRSKINDAHLVNFKELALFGRGSLRSPTVALEVGWDLHRRSKTLQQISRTLFVHCTARGEVANLLKTGADE